MKQPTCSWHLEGHLPCGKPAHVVKVIVIKGPGVGKVAEVDWCDSHEKMFYDQQKEEYLN
jgi:hypothetical protein